MVWFPTLVREALLLASPEAQPTKEPYLVNLRLLFLPGIPSRRMVITLMRYSIILTTEVLHG